MSIRAKYLAPFEEGGYYHVYNRTNNRELLFREPENYRYFLQKYKQFAAPFPGTFAYALLPNHFHFIVRVKQLSAITAYLDGLPPLLHSKAETVFLEKGAEAFPGLVEKAFHRFFTGYAVAFNNRNERYGNLFHRPFLRLRINDDAHWQRGIVYAHTNALKHGIVRDFTTYPWTSYHACLSEAATMLCRDEVLRLFGGREPFIALHGLLASRIDDHDSMEEA